MVHSDLKNTIDLIKNINGLQLNFNNQNLNFKQYSRNSKYITFTNQAGIDVNVPLDDLNNQYKKKYIISNESSVDTSIFNSKNKSLGGGNEDISATSASFMSKIKNDNIAVSLTSDLLIKSNSSKTSVFLVGGNNEDNSATSTSFMSKINNDDIGNSLTSNSSQNSNLSNTSIFLVGGNNEDLSPTSYEEASAFESESLSKNEKLVGGGSENINNKFVSINLNDIRNKIKNEDSRSDTINYESSSTLNSITELKHMSNQVSDSVPLNKLLKQNGGGNSSFINNNKSYNINSSSTSSVCE